MVGIEVIKLHGIIPPNILYDKLSRCVFPKLSSIYGLQIKIVQDPEAFLMMDDSPIVFPRHPMFDAAEIALCAQDKEGSQN
jgi:hypothetical protein